ncbi:heterokaryon incompatibility protein-domain-containing protein [Cercophora newfieldiana]|uniref:Heterokaryon incompatibility protein-domain-containing protein n=1 Tax=Cercophora newfieldiana TaxID=92897 RepID=A0AA39YJ46_9PEZI|nr:heterokaryon incompatibility protein-domain-containing protein [Cercophora newfieldiana]
MAFHLLDTSTFELKCFSESVPDYAILSHTWETDQEVSYQEMTAAAQNASHPARNKSGFRKIQKTCGLARAEGLGFAWIDTCCIDKSSSAELSEAINSMFQWYQRAEVCYAYLSDLPPDVEDQLEDHMSRCRWFTRGWCLQELIAPRDVRFYDSAWQPIGRKTELSTLLSRITKIRENVLVEPGLLATLTVAERMSWAAGRETTRAEDTAYCLLGIFDINMPMLYGEGKKAFLRLQEEIIRRSNDLSIFAWVGSQTSAAQGLEAPRFTDLFAESTRDFSGCSGFRQHPWAGQRKHTFSLTNNGLRLTGVSFNLDFENGYYWTALGDSSDGATRYLILKKITSKIFFRVTYEYWERETFFYGEDGEVGSTDDMDIFIPPKIGAAEIGFSDASDGGHVQLRLDNRLTGSMCQLHRTIIDVFPRETWDASRLLFSNEGDTPWHSHGYVKFDGTLFRARMVEIVTDHRAPPEYPEACQNFYLIWCTGSWDSWDWCTGTRDSWSLGSFVGASYCIDAKLCTGDDFAVEWESLERSQLLWTQWPLSASSLIEAENGRESEPLPLAQTLALRLGSGEVTITAGRLDPTEDVDNFYIELSYHCDD